jgi:hypothetical protein
MWIRIAKTLVCVLLAATASQAGITTANVKVLVSGKRCIELKDVYLVINGKDLEDRWVKLDPAGTCRWKTDLGDGGTISTDDARFSLRAGLARSGCQKAGANETEMTANLEFSCCIDGPFRNLRVKIEPSMPVSYARNVQPFPEDRSTGIPCSETATFTEGRGSISNAIFGREHIYLHLGPYDRNPPALGLLLDDIITDEDRSVLTIDGVTFRLMVQRAQGKMRSAPTLSSNAITLDIKKLEALKFERAEFEVIK